MTTSEIEDQQTYYCYLVPPEEYAKADADFDYRPREVFVGTVEAEYFLAAEAKATKKFGSHVYVSETPTE